MKRKHMGSGRAIGGHTAGLLVSAAMMAAAWTADAGAMEDRFIYMGLNLGNAERVAMAKDLVRRAAKAGFNGLVAQGDIEYAFMGSGTELRNLRELKQLCDEVGMDLVPAIWSIGYGTMLHANPNLAAALPVEDVPYVVSEDGTKAVFASDRKSIIVNGDFEDVKPSSGGSGFRADGWVLDKPGEISFVDKDVKASGKQSIRFELSASGRAKDPQARAYQFVKVLPNRRYRVRARIRTEGLDTASGFQITVTTRPGRGEVEGMTRQLTMNTTRLQKTGDWTEITAEVSTLEYDSLAVYLGSWYARAGRFWLDDVVMEEIGFSKFLRRPGCPVVVRNANTGMRYVEGRDFRVPSASREDMKKARFENGSVVVEVPLGSRMRAGTRLLVSGYSPHRMKSSSQVCTCMSEPELYRLFEKSAAALEEILHPRKWFLPLDEVRSGGTCQACRARNTDMAHIFGDCVTRQREIIRRVAPDATVFMWGDQIDPNMNARRQVYMCRGSFVGGADLVPKDIVIMHWGNKLAETLAFFREKGFRTARSRSIDGNWKNGVPQHVIDDFRIACDDPACRGFMYTTWRQDYSQEKIDAFSELWKSAPKCD